jgi:alkyldihydroxyacetonephosphate synthase
MNASNLRWWGWGTTDQSCSLESQPDLWAVLRSELALADEIPAHRPMPLESVNLRPPRLDDPVLSSLRRLLGEETVRTDRQARAEHACGKSYRDLLRLRAGRIDNPPDAVIYPASEGQVAAAVSWAAERDIAIVPFGGGSSVLGGVETAPGPRPSITLDLGRLNQVVSVDQTTWISRIQAGIRGPELEEALNAHGFTLGHFPQSFEFSTLGGWIATRSVGQASSGYGTIEDLTQAIRLVAPTGIVESMDTPITSTVPDLLSVVVGSEGQYGVITEASMRVRPLPEIQDYRGFLFHHLSDGLSALRTLIQQGPRPTIARLSDAAETTLFATISHERNGLRALVVRGLETYLTLKGHSFTGGNCLLILGYDGKADPVQKAWQQAATICQDHRGASLGRTTAETWKRTRFRPPYLRDALLDRGIMVGSLVTAAPWPQLERLYEDVTVAVQAAIRATGGGPGHVLAHLTHVCEMGASIRMTFLGHQVPGQEIKQWWAVKQAAQETIRSAGGRTSHHHGMAWDEAPRVTREIGPVGVTILRNLKQSIDPTEIMNPGVRIPSA